MKKTSKTVNLKVKKYFKDGKHTCAFGIIGDCCIFLGSRRFGSVQECMATGDEVLHIEPYYIEPCKNCILRKCK